MTPQQNKEIREDFYKQFARRNAMTNEIEPNWFIHDNITAREMAAYWLTILDKALSQQREEMRESGEEGEGTWKGKKIKDMSRLEIIEAWKATDELYRASLLSNPLTK